MLRFHDRFHFGDDLGVLCRQVLTLGGIAGQIVELYRLAFEFGLCLAFARSEAGFDQLPVCLAHALLAAVTGKLTIDEFALRLLFTQQGGGKADAVELCGRLVFGAGEFEQGGHPVFKSSDPV